MKMNLIVVVLLRMKRIIHSSLVEVIMNTHTYTHTRTCSHSAFWPLCKFIFQFDLWILTFYKFDLSIHVCVDELLTLMGTGALVEDELEELLSLTSRNRSEESSSRSGREGRPTGMYNDPLVAQEIRSWVTLADRAATGNGSAPSSSTGHTSTTSGGKNKSGSSRKDHLLGSSMYMYNKVCWMNENGHVHVSQLMLYIHYTIHVHMTYMYAVHVHMTYAVHVHVHRPIAGIFAGLDFSKI